MTSPHSGYWHSVFGNILYLLLVAKLSNISLLIFAEVSCLSMCLLLFDFPVLDQSSRVTMNTWMWSYAGRMGTEKKNVSRGREGISVVKNVCSKRKKTWVRIPRIPIQKAAMTKHTSNPSMESGRDRQIPNVHWLDSLADIASGWVRT